MTEAELIAYNAACPPTGSYYCKIFKFIHIGTKEEVFAQTNEKKDINKFRMYLEFLTHPLFVFDKQKGAQPWTCNVESTWSTSDRSNLYKYIKGIYRSDKKTMDDLISGRFDIANLLGQLVMVDTTQNISKKSGKAGIKVTNITAPLELPGYDLTPLRNQRLFNEMVIFDIDGFLKKNPADLAAFKKLHKFEQKMIAETDEWKYAGLRLEDYADQNTQAPVQQGYAVGQPVQQGYAQQAPIQQGFTPSDDDLPF